MSTALRLGPSEHGRPVSFDAFRAADCEEGHRYELIDGRLFVSPLPDPSHDWIETWLFRRLDEYVHTHPDFTNHVTPKARVFVPDAGSPTAPEPDLAVHRDYSDSPAESWRDVSPLVVAAIVGPRDDVKKDLEHNVDLDFRVPSIDESWGVDLREDPEHPRLLAHRRRDESWSVLEITADDSYESEALPGFVLTSKPSPP